MAAIAAALLPMLDMPPAHMFAATNMLVCVLLLLHFCAELLFSLCVSRSGRLRSCRGRAVRHANGGYGGQLDPCEKLISLERTSVLRAYKQFLLAKVSLFAVRLPVLTAMFPLRLSAGRSDKPAGDDGITRIIPSLWTAGEGSSRGDV